MRLGRSERHGGERRKVRESSGGEVRSGEPGVWMHDIQ
jgi:hypothetical protein